MGKDVTPPQQQTPTSHPLTSGGILQRKCMSCGQYQAARDKCDNCDEQQTSPFSQVFGNNDTAIQRKANSQKAQVVGEDFSRISITNSKRLKHQPKLKMGHPNDKYEKEADRVSEQVMKMSDPVQQSKVENQEEEELIQPKLIEHKKDLVIQTKPFISRPDDRYEEEADRIAEKVVKEESSNLNIHRKVSDDESEISLNDHLTLSTNRKAAAYSDNNPQNNLENQLRSVQQGGHPLPSTVKSFMESRFNTDFSQVRIHSDPQAAKTAEAINARAYTMGRHVVFGTKQYAPDSFQGRQLLAHELTHVVQQRGESANSERVVGRSIALNNTVPNVQKNGDGESEQDDTAQPEGRRPFALILFYRNGESQAFYTLPLFGDNPSIPADYYLEVSLFFDSPSVFDTSIGPYRIPSLRPVGITLDEIENNYDQSDRTVAVVLMPDGSIPPIAGGDEESESRPSEGREDSEGAEEGEEAEQESGGGSRYGWLGILDLPEDLISLLETVIETLEMDEEILGIRETLQSLMDISAHIDEISSWFEDPDKIVSIILGLEDNAAIAAIENWVNRPERRRRASRRRARRGIARLAAKLVHIVEKLRRILRPVFTVRQEFLAIFASIIETVNLMPSTEHLIAALQHAEGGMNRELENLIREFSNSLSEQLQAEIQSAGALFSISDETFSEDDLVTYEELAQGITTAILAAVRHPVVRVARGIPGLEDAVSDNIVAPMIPEAVLDNINAKIRDVISPALSTIGETVNPKLEQIAEDIGPELQDYLMEEIPHLIGGSPADAEDEEGPEDEDELSPQPSLEKSASRTAKRPVNFPHLLRHSQGAPIPHPVRQDMEERMGYDFSEVKIHANSAADQAAQQLRAKAFTLGADIYFQTRHQHLNRLEGRRLLAHELTHVIQQSRGFQTGIIQPDYDELVRNLRNRLGDRISGALRVQPSASVTPAMEADAERIRDVIIPRLTGGVSGAGRGHRVRRHPSTSRILPSLPIPYIYHRYRGPRDLPTRIRRRSRWMGLVPALTIRRGRIRLQAVERVSSLSDLYRRQLRRALSCRSNQQAHHVIPLELRNDFTIIEKAERNGWQFNGVDNGRCISNRIHNGSHPTYTADVRRRLTQLETRLRRTHGSVEWETGGADFEDIVSDLKGELRRRRRRLT